MATERNRRRNRKDSHSRLNGLMERLSAHFSQEEIHKIFGHSLLALDPAGLERMAAGLETETAAALRKALKPTRGLKKSKAPSHPTIGKTRQEWDSAWRDWDACISETADESGKYVLQENHWEPPYLDKTGFADNLEPIAARIHTLLPHVFERNLAPDFSFAQALLNAAEEIGGNSEDIEDSGEGLAIGPQVTRCLLEWEWNRARRDHLGGFEFLDGICALEHSGEDLSLDHSTIGNFISASGLKKASPALHRLLLREPEGDRRVTTLRRTWLKRLRAGELLPEVIQFWKRQAALLVPDPEHCAGDYRDCAEWLAVLHDFDALACKKIVEQWKLTHRRRKNLGKTLERAKLISY